MSTAEHDSLVGFSEWAGGSGETATWAGRSQPRQGGRDGRNPPAGCQAQLNRLVKVPSFREILNEELKLRNLRECEADSCIAVMYHEGSKYAHGNTREITTDHRYHRKAEAGITSFLPGMWQAPSHST